MLVRCFARLFVAILIAMTTLSLCSPFCLRSIVFSEMEHAKKTDDPTATVCAELSNHEVKCCNVFAIVR